MAFFESFTNVSKTQQFLLLVFGLIVVVVLAYLLPGWGISAMSNQNAQLSGQHEVLQKEIADKLRTLADLENVRREVVALERQLEALKERLPTEKELPNLYRTLSDSAVQAGLGVSLFQPKEPQVRDYYSQIPITVTAEGGYHDLGAFFERIAKFPRVVTVEDMKLTGLAKAKNSLRADLTLATYMYRPIGSPPAPKPGAPK